MKKVIVFDLDGTLLDTLEDLKEAVNYALKENGMPERTMEEIRRFVGNGVRRLVQLAVPGGEENPKFEEVFKAFRAYYMVHCDDHTGLYPGIAELLQKLHAEGYRMAVVSNKLQSGVDELYERYFKGVIEIAIGERPEVARKPAPDMVWLALRELGVDKSESIYIGDSEVDVATARNAGLPCISVLWGFRTKAELLEAGATTFASSTEELFNVIQ